MGGYIFIGKMKRVLSVENGKLGNSHSVQDSIGFREDLVSYSHCMNNKGSPFKKTKL